MKNIKWIIDAAKKSKEYKYAVCPYLKNDRCSNYADRFQCCKNFPKSKGYCSKSNCRTLKNNIENNSKLSSKECSRCKNICCKKILVPENIKITKKFISKWMDIDCKNCNKIFKQ